MKYILDKLVSSNEAKTKLLNEKQLQWEFEVKDDIRTVAVDEKALDEQFERDLKSEGLETMRVSISTKLNFQKANKNPRQLVEKYLYLKKMCEMVERKALDEKEMAASLSNKILVLQKDIVIL